MLTGPILLSKEEEDERSLSNLASAHTHTHTVGKPSGRVSLASPHREREADGAEAGRDG